MAMDKKTVMGFLLIGLALVFSVLSKMWGIDGAIEEISKSLIAAGIFFICGYQLNEYRKQIP